MARRWCDDNLVDKPSAWFCVVFVHLVNFVTPCPHARTKQKPKRSFSKRQPEQLLEHYVSSCVKKIVTTASPMQEEVKAQDVVSALKNAQKDNRKNSQTGKSKKRDNRGSPGERRRSSADEERPGERRRQAQKKSKGKGQGTAANKSQTKSSGKGKKNTSKGRGSGRGKKGGKHGGKTGGKSKGQKPSMTRSICWSNDAGLAIAVRLPEHQASHLLSQPRDPLC